MEYILYILYMIIRYTDTSTIMYIIQFSEWNCCQKNAIWFFSISAANGNTNKKYELTQHVFV